MLWVWHLGESIYHSPDLQKLTYLFYFSSIVNSWLTYASCFGVAYSYGGGQVAVYSPIISALTQWIMLQGVSELASAFPSSGVSHFKKEQSHAITN